VNGPVTSVNGIMTGEVVCGYVGAYIIDDMFNDFRKDFVTKMRNHVCDSIGVVAARFSHNIASFTKTVVR
jgi:hypothetical protein